MLRLLRVFLVAGLLVPGLLSFDARPAEASSTVSVLDLPNPSSTSCPWSNSWRTGSVSVGGSTFDRSLFCFVGSRTGTGVRDYDLGRAYRRFAATVGFADSSVSTGQTIRVVVRGDGVELERRDITFGTPVALVVNVENVLRLSLEVSQIAGGGSAAVVWGSPVVTTGTATTPPLAFPVVPLQSWQLGASNSSITWTSCPWSNSWRTGTYSITSQTYTSSVSCFVGSSGAGTIDYNLSRRYRTLETVFGIASDSPQANDQLRVRVFGDGRTLYDSSVRIGSPQTARIDVAGVLRLVVRVEGQNDGGDGYSSRFVMGSPIVLPPTTAVAMVDSASRLWNNIGNSASGFARLAGGARVVEATSRWLLMIDSANQLWVKAENPVTPWRRIATGAASVTATESGRILMVDTGGQLWAKEGDPFGAWQRIARGVAQVDADGNRIVLVDRSNRVWAREGALGTGFTLLGTGARKITVSGNRIVMQTRTGDLWAKQGGLTAGWVRVARGVVDHDISGSRMAIVDSAGRLWAKDGDLTASWVLRSGGGQANVWLAGDRILVRGTTGRLFMNSGSIRAPFFIVASGARTATLA